LDHWGYPHSTVSAAGTSLTLNQMLALGANVNMYMFHGGTSFGFTAGSNGGDTSFQVCPTSYDYAAPISESGEPNTQYYALREVISQYVDEDLLPVPASQAKYAYGSVQMSYVAALLDVAEVLSPSPVMQSDSPLTFESVGQAYGFILYTTTLQGKFMDPAILSVPGIHDRGYVFLDGSPVGVVMREDTVTSLPLMAVSAGQTLQILVENQGRICYGSDINDFKGITQAVTLGSTTLTNWTHVMLPFNDTSVLQNVVEQRLEQQDVLIPRRYGVYETSTRYVGPALYTGEFVVPSTVDPVQDTFLQFDGWSKGVVFVNGFNLGRYWPNLGPQVTLYLPAPLLNPYPESNTITVLELQYATCVNTTQCTVQLLDTAVLDAETPYTSGSSMTPVAVGKAFVGGNKK